MSLSHALLWKMPPQLIGPIIGAAYPLLPLISPRHRARRDVRRKLGEPQYVVRQGPFKGMRYLTMARGSNLLPKMTGTYEMELHPAIEALIAEAPDIVIDLGSAEGYYAVGFAKRLPAARIICFEVDKFANYLMRRLARLNGAAKRVEPHGLATAQTLEATLASAARPALMCDIEGAEDELIDPAATPSMRRTILLIEIHDHVTPGIGDRIRARFAQTHELTVIPTVPRTPGDLPAGLNLSEDETAVALDEGRRVPQYYLFMRPKSA